MKKGRLILIIISFITLFLILGVIQLSIKNNKLKFLSDNSRQIIALKQIYEEIIISKNSGNIFLQPDSSIYKNFINYTTYSEAQKADIDALFNNFSSIEQNKEYKISSEFNVKKLQLIVTIENISILDTSKYIYNLDMDKKNNAITFKQISFEHEIE